MTQREIELFLSWIVNEEIRLEDEVHDMQSRLRLRKIDISDSFEMAVALQRLEDFREFSLIAIRLLHIDDR